MKVFLTMLALKDSDDVCRLNAYQLHRRSRKTETQVLDALKTLASPDTKRVEIQAHEGRRIKAVEDGWLILNGAKYRDMVQLEMKRARNRRSQAAWRGRQRGGPTAAEREVERGVEDGTIDPKTLEAYDNEAPAI